LEARIRELEEEIKNSEVITTKHKKGTVVELGSEVEVENVEDKEKIFFTLVGSTEVDPLNSKFSNESPIGMAVIGKTIGDLVTVEAPAGNIDYKIIKVA